MHWLHIITAVITAVTALFLLGIVWLETRRAGMTASLVLLYIALGATAVGCFLHLLQTAGVL